MTESTKSSKTPKRNGSWWRKNWFYTVLIAVALLGGLGAFWIPFWPPQPFSEGDSISTLRQSILAATGGVLAILTLWENRRKNIQEKEKNDQDHTRQVHAERRVRYAKAIEQLADEKAPIRLGGVYTLAKLVDDWLDDEKTLRSMEKRRQEGQIIIDSLCAYIRSSFPLAERHDELTLSYEEYQQKYQDNQGKNQATQSVENSADNSTPKPEEHQDNKQSREEFVRDKSIFREEQEVRQTILSEIEKRLNSNKDKNEDGKGEVKPGTWSYFEYDFSNTVFFYYTQFNYSYFGNPSSFFRATFTQDAKFFRATFQDTCFYEATFAQNASFFRATFQDANFYETTFTQDADFSGATFLKNVDFSEAIFQNKPVFEYTLSNKTYKARFLYKKDDPRNYNFEVSPDSPYKIETEKHLSPDRTIITIPKGCIVFNPLLTKISISDDSIKGISVKGVSANGVPQVEKKLKLKMSPWPKKSESNTKH
ncbi:pentapeptide repeat-containing protein [Rothia dentocariosa]|uniref:pentapeptide repeat-containing protein n=1 Tax=Rothia dentocariosa TaxID=2047 RepID=UPI000660AE70|nr:pentapeptide repeat-containing protein [Rothia dentocariosa]TFI33211.1 pentapeptide repeat-containing protein [Rothia dentocariosa]